MENIFVEFLPPWVETGLQPAFYDKESGSVLQQTARMYARVNMLIRMFNKLSKNTKTTVEDYISQFNTLYNYVHDYFDNLDVQEEINHKLDEMVESGELQSVISSFGKILQIYDTFSDLTNDENITSGYVKTLGLVSRGDGFGAIYEVGETGDIELASGAYATIIANIGGNNYYNITTTTHRAYNTTYYITEIPVNDANNEPIKPYVALCPNGPLEYSQVNNTSLTINASLGTHTVISNGEVIQNRDYSNYLLPDAAVYIGIKADRTIAEYQANLATGSAMISDGVKEAWLAFYNIIKNNQFADFDEIDEQWRDEGANIATSRHPRQCIGTKNDKTIVILTTEGRIPDEVGMTSEECATILHDLGCTNAWNLDGGGSTSTAIKGYKINSNIQDNYTADRKINACLNVKYLITDKELADTNSRIGSEINDNNRKLMPMILPSMVTNLANKDADTLFTGQSLHYCVNMTHTPYGAGYLVTIPTSLVDMVGKYGTQLFIHRNNGRMFTRIIQNELINDWMPSDGYKFHIYDRANSYFSVVEADTYETYTFTEAPYIKTNVSNYMTLATIADNAVTLSGSMKHALLTITFDLTTTATSGTRYVRLLNGEDIVSESVSQFQSDGTQSVTTRTITAYIDTSKNFSLQIYGKTNDRISRLKIVGCSFD